MPMDRLRRKIAGYTEILQLFTLEELQELKKRKKHRVSTGLESIVHQLLDQAIELKRLCRYEQRQ